MDEAPIMVRVRITREEWVRLRQIALARNTATADLIAEALRTGPAPLRHLIEDGEVVSA